MFQVYSGGQCSYPCFPEVLLKKHWTQYSSQADGCFPIVETMESTEPHSSVGSVADLRTGRRWFDPRLSQYSFRGLMIAIATGFIPLSPLSVASMMVTWESSQWLGKNIVRSTG